MTGALSKKTEANPKPGKFGSGSSEDRTKSIKKSGGFIPSFDLFGISPTFYVSRQKKSMTWMGCICSILMVGSLAAIFIISMRSYWNKSDSQITQTVINNSKHPYVNLKSKG